MNLNVYTIRDRKKVIAQQPVSIPDKFQPGLAFGYPVNRKKPT